VICVARSARACLAGEHVTNVPRDPIDAPLTPYGVDPDEQFAVAVQRPSLDRIAGSERLRAVSPVRSERSRDDAPRVMMPCRFRKLDSRVSMM
jgi:hypothetical protein